MEKVVYYHMYHCKNSIGKKSIRGGKTQNTSRAGGNQKTIMNSLVFIRTHNKHSQSQQQEATCRPLRPGNTLTYVLFFSFKIANNISRALRLFPAGWCWGWGRSPRPRERSLDLLLCLCDCHLGPPPRSSGCQVYLFISNLQKALLILLRALFSETM